MSGQGRIQDRYDLPEPVRRTATSPTRVDLHAHTSRSDGVLSPAELYAAMAEAGIRVAAIADHDVLDAYRELRDAGLLRRPDAPAAGAVQLIPAVEINAVAEHIPDLAEPELHILGYGVDVDDPAFEALMAGQRAARGNRLGALVDRMREIGMPIDDVIGEALSEDVASAGRPHVARALVRAGHVESVQDAFDRVLTRGGPGYVPRQGMRVREAIEAISAAGGIPILAHFPAAPDVAERIEELREWGLRGLEVYYRRFADDQVERLREFATARGLLITGGSDFHGDTGSYAESLVTTHVPDHVADTLVEAIESQRVGAR